MLKQAGDRGPYLLGAPALLCSKRLPLELGAIHERRGSRVLGSLLPAINAQATPKIVYLSDMPAPIREYATHVTDKGTP
jgi:hypothetical protein